MTEQFILKFLTDAIYTTMLLAGPLLLVALIMGLMVGIFQAVTSINEMTLTFIPKVLAIIVLLLVLLPWMIRVLLNYTVSVFDLINIVAK